jgi:hypothetical protein
MTGFLTFSHPYNEMREHQKTGRGEGTTFLRSVVLPALPFG